MLPTWPSFWPLEFRHFRSVCLPLFLGQPSPEVLPDPFPDPATPVGKLLWEQEGEGEDSGNCDIDCGHAAGSISHGSSEPWADSTLEGRFQTHLHPTLRPLADFGRKQSPPSGPEDGYDLIDERHAPGNVLLNSHPALEERPDPFCDPLLASDGTDRPSRLARRDHGDRLRVRAPNSNPRTSFR